MSFFSIFFHCSFIWNKFLYLLILLNFFCLYSIRWNSYISCSWRSFQVWEHPYSVCMCPVALVGGLDLTWAQVPSFLSVCWQNQVWGRTSPLLSGHHHPIGCKVWSEIAGAEALRVGSKLILFPLSVCSPSPTSIGTFAPKWAVLEQEGPEWVSGAGRSVCWGVPGTSVKSSRLLWIYLLHEHESWLPSLCSDAVLDPSSLIPNNWASLSAGAASILVWTYAMEITGPERLLGLGWGVCWGSWEKLARTPGSFYLLPLPCFRSVQACAHSSLVESKFLTAPLSLPLHFYNFLNYIFTDWWLCFLFYF